MNDQEVAAENHRKATSLSILVVVGVLVLAMLGMPYGFYMLVRFAVFCLLAYILCFAKGIPFSKKQYFFLVVTCVIFNPFAPVHLSAPLWKVIDAGLILYLLKLRSVIRSVQRSLDSGAGTELNSEV